VTSILRFKLNIDTCWIQEVLMLVSLNRPRSTQLALFAQPHPKPDWRELAPETQQKVLRLLTLLLQQGVRSDAVQGTEEGHDE
jgi:hypothetical protein